MTTSLDVNRWNLSKNWLLAALFFLATVPFVQAQKFGFVDTEYVLDQVSDYKDAQKQLDEIAESWRKEIQAKYEKIEDLYKAFQAEEVLLTEEMKRQREDEIINKEKEAKQLQKQRFGYEGDLFRKRQELVKPIQDKVYAAIKKVAERKSLNFIFDKANGVTMLYADPKYDMSGEVLKELGISAVSKKD